MVRANQGGLVLRFIIIGIVLAGLLVGGVYVVRHHILNAIPSQTVTPPELTSSEVPKPEEGVATKQPQETAQSAPAPTPTTTPQSQVTALPQSGSDGMGSFIALTFLAIGIVSYVHSRRPEHSL